jgi:hypothetical protein
MVLGVIAENSLPLSIAPVLVELSRALAEDKVALANVQLSRTTASYKLTHGLGYTFTERLHENLRRYPFSMNIDESTSSNNNKVLAMLVSFYNPNTRQVEVEYLGSINLLKVNAAAVRKSLVNFFAEHDLPWLNLISLMMDSCAVMRGSKSGVETQIRANECKNMLNIDGDSCHHIHNVAKMFCRPFGNWLEQLLLDLHTDHKWSPDQVHYLSEICEFMDMPFTTPQRFIPHRWLSAYDVGLSTERLLAAYKVLYFGFLSKDDKVAYQSVLDDIYRKHSVGAKAEKRITSFHDTLTSKSMTDKGKARKRRIIKRIYFEERTTKLHLSLYLSVLAIMKEYVMVFQGKDTLVHKLHDQQIAIFTNFLACFIKAEYLQERTPEQLKKFDVTDPQSRLALKHMFVGDKADAYVKENPKDSVVRKFLQLTSEAYTTCAAYMQGKLPLESKTLQALSAIDPIVRGHSVTVLGLKTLGGLMKHLLPKDNQVTSEIQRFCVDSNLPSFVHDGDIVGWWSGVMESGRYPALSVVVTGALSCFHGPMVESSFNVMGDVLDAKSGNMKTDTYSSFQTVKYALRSSRKTAIEYFKLEDKKYGPVDKRLCRDIRGAASRYKAGKERKLKAKVQRQKEYTCKPAGSAQTAKKTQQETEYAARLAHAEKERKKARKRALEVLADVCVKKKKKLN